MRARSPRRRLADMNTTPAQPSRATTEGYDVREHRMARDTRTIAWTDAGPLDGTPVVRFHGTPGSRWSLIGNRAIWARHGLRMVTPERPGYGASTALPGWRFTDHADDVAAVLDDLGLERVHLLGISGGAPHVLAFAARHPDRVAAAAIAVGAAPFTDDEVEHMLPENRISVSLVRSGNLGALRARTAGNRENFLADPDGWLRAVMASAPESDRALMEDPDWSEWFYRGALEAVRASPDGWVDDACALFSPWAIDLSAVRCQLTWWHGAEDRNVPLSAARRLVAQLPHGRLRLFPPGSGHLATYHHEAEILAALVG